MINEAQIKRGQPLTFGEVVQQTIAIYRANFAPMLLLSIIIAVPAALLMAYLLSPVVTRLTDLQQTMLITAQNSGLLSPDLINQLGGILASVGMIVIAVSFVQAVLLNTALTYISSESYFGVQPSIVKTFQAISPRLPTFALAMLLVYALLVLIGAGLMAILFACGFGFGIIAYASLTLLSFLTPVAVLERKNIVGTIGRTFALGKLHIWTIFRITILVLIVTQIVNLILTPITSGVTDSAAGLLVTVLMLVIQAALAPLLPIAMTLLYYDARNRFEGLGTLLAAAENPNARPADFPTPILSASLNSRDISNVVVMSIVILLLLGVLYFAQTLLTPLVG